MVAGRRPTLAGSEQLGDTALVVQQVSLTLEATGVAAQPATRVQDAVAWHDDGDRVRPERVAGGAGGSGRA